MVSPDEPVPESYPNTTIRSVSWAKDIDLVRRFFQEYRQWLDEHRDVDPAVASTVAAGLGGIDELITGLPGAYGPPRGEILLAFEKEEPTACLALREMEARVGDLKRLYVRPDHRGPVFGRRFTKALLARARELGYERVRVDTLATMYAAIEFYQEAGFTPIPGYWPHPVRGALFFECVLGNASSPPKRHRPSISKRSAK
jgi:GNAT superfamily N-acetyltransferase